MAKKDSLETYIKKSQKGDKNAYRKVIEELYSEIYNLSAFIYEDDEIREKITKHLFIKAFKSIADFDSEECDIHLWMAREATREIYNVVVKSEDNIFSNEIEQRDYSFESIEEDDELGEASAEFNESFLTEEGFDPATEFAANLTIGEKIIYLLYCYEGYTIDEIESIIEIDSSFIMSEIAGMRDGVLAAYAPIKAENDGVVEDVLADNAIAAGYGNNDGDTDSDGFEYESEDEYDEDQDDDEDYEDDQDDVFYSGRRSRAGVIDDRNKKKYAIGKLKLTEKELKGLIIGVVAAVVLIIVIVIVAVASGHNRDRNNNAVTTEATKPQVTNNTTVEPTTAQEETTTEEETTTKKKVQQGTQPQVEINTTTAAPTQPTTQPTTQPPTQPPTPISEQKPVVPPVNNNSNNNGANGGNNPVGGGSNTSEGNNTSGGGSNTSGGNNTSGGGNNTSEGNNTSGEGSNTSGGNNTSGGGSNTSGGNNTAGGSNNTGGINTSNNSGNTSNESSNTGNNVQQQ